jgi:hypothetical protein
VGDAGLLRISKRGTAQGRATDAPAGSSDAIRFVVSSDTPDEFGDVVVQRGLSFPGSVPALVDHDHRLQAQVGSWSEFETTEHETRATLRLVPRGTSRLADLARALYEGGHGLASSVFFMTSRADTEPITRSDRNGQEVRTGTRFKRGTVREITLTPMPANPAAVAVARSLGFASDELAALLRTSADSSGAPPVAAVAAPPAAQAVARSMGPRMDLSDQIAAAEAAATQADEALATANAAIDGNAASLQAVADATAAVNAAYDRVQVLRNAQAAAARRAAGANGNGNVIDVPSRIVPDNPGANLAVRQPNMPPVSRALAPSLIHRMPEPDRPGGYRIAQLAIAKYFAYKEKRPLDVVAAEIFGTDQAALAVARAAATVADTTTAGWAAELVRSDARAMMQTDLAPMGVWSQLAAAGLPLNFNGAPAITIPSASNFQDALEPAWVGEAGVIPVVKGAITSQRITRNKLAGIIPITNELARTSDPSAVEVMRQMLRQATANLLDKSLLDSAAAVAGVRPKGLLNGVTLGTGAAGGGVNALIADLKTMVGALQTAHLGSSRVVLIVNSATKLSLGLLVNPLGQVPSIISGGCRGHAGFVVTVRAGRYGDYARRRILLFGLRPDRVRRERTSDAHHGRCWRRCADASNG